MSLTKNKKIIYFYLSKKTVVFILKDRLTYQNLLVFGNLKHKVIMFYTLLNYSCQYFLF